METTISGRIQLHGFGIATLAILAILFMSIGGCQSVHRPEADLVITNVDIVDVVDGKITSDNDVFITGDTISDITRAGSLPHPANAIILDGNGKFLIPGLWDAHVHVISNSAWQMPLMLAHGITSVRNMHTTEPDPLIAIKRVKADIDAGAYPSPRLLASGPIIDGPNISAWPSSVIVDSPASAKAAVKQQQADGADFIKVYSALDAPSMMAILEQAEKSGIAVDGHMPASIDPAVAVSAGMRTVEHTSGVFAGCSDNELIVRNKFHEYFTGDPSPFPSLNLRFFLY
ncbi:amidohydrolase family protein [Alteromonas sp. H39]|uniref:amidohydrolase family protein n=1 Tax=Alteromonas sp. H39 TaxID=3389876 RepID=UPI0039E0C4C6